MLLSLYRASHTFVLSMRLYASAHLPLSPTTSLHILNLRFVASLSSTDVTSSVPEWIESSALPVPPSLQGRMNRIKSAAARSVAATAASGGRLAGGTETLETLSSASKPQTARYIYMCI